MVEIEKVSILLLCYTDIWEFYFDVHFHVTSLTTYIVLLTESETATLCLHFTRNLVSLRPRWMDVWIGRSLSSKSCRSQILFWRPLNSCPSIGLHLWFLVNLIDKTSRDHLGSWWVLVFVLFLQMANPDIMHKWTREIGALLISSPIAAEIRAHILIPWSKECLMEYALIRSGYVGAVDHCPLLSTTWG